MCFRKLIAQALLDGLAGVGVGLQANDDEVMGRRRMETNVMLGRY